MTVALAHLPLLTIESVESSQSIFTLVIGFLLYKIFGDRFKENLDKKDVIKKLISFFIIICGIYLVVK